jgi:PAS domain S-box-containing protein
LVRVDKALKLGRDSREPGDTPLVQPPVAAEQPDTFWRNCSTVEKRNWENFIRSGRVDPDAVPSPILDSWHRCLQAEVEFAGGRCQDILSVKELEKRQNQLLEVAEPLMDALCHYLRGFGFVIVLTDSDGYILKSVGALESLRRAESINFGPGANWSELSVGTNAIGTALAMGRALQVTGPEHYNDGHHLWTCAATPIQDHEGRIVGCLDISGPRENARFNIMDMGLATARFIEERLYLEQAQRFMERSNKYMNTALDSVNDGIVSVNMHGVIDGANASAARLLGLERRLLLGKRIDEALPLKAAARLLREENRGRKETMVLPTRSGEVRCLVSAQPIHEDCGTGVVITLTEASRQAPHHTRGPVGRPVRYSFEHIIGESPAMVEAVQRARMAAQSRSTVLILGESGTGKEVFAQAIHQEGLNRNGPFVSINCGAIPRELIQSEFFGHVEGAFTGAARGGRQGKLEQAHGGTLFLDEIADLPLDMQANLLRVLEDEYFSPVGSNRVIRSEVRYIAATNRPLFREVRAGRFREDLYYRLNVVVLTVPPLRERGQDVHLLTDFHLSRLSRALNKPVARVDQSFREILAEHDWPGNVRELINVLEQAINFMPGHELCPEHLPPYLQNRITPNPQVIMDEVIPLDLLEKYAIEQALSHCQYNISRVAQALGIGRNTLYSKMKKYGIHQETRKKPTLGGLA